ncbi:MAG: ABC transporter ATP-binding protein [Methylococcaceae bacterium]|nr:ABC transporter ATP-binding protein [Methylococcaceae bacterium]
MNSQGLDENPPLFRIRDLTKIYRSGEVEVQALRGVDLELYRGEFIVLLGPSGSGKSTLLNILGGLDMPTSGQVSFRDVDLGELDERGRTLYRRDTIGYVFQSYNLISGLTARENVALATEIVANPLSPETALGLVGLADRMDHFPSQLSGGEQQRVSVARAIAKRPAILLCDEPTGALDSNTGIVVLEVIQDVSRKLDTTTVLITHNVAIADLADRVVSFANGKISEVRNNERKRSARELSW